MGLIRGVNKSLLQVLLPLIVLGVVGAEVVHKLVDVEATCTAEAVVREGRGDRRVELFSSHRFFLCSAS